jgi:hypothetical protein
MILLVMKKRIKNEKINRGTNTATFCPQTTICQMNIGPVDEKLNSSNNCDE